jgi:lipopolysaccharide export system protein LptA
MIRAALICVALIAGIGLGAAAKPKAPFGDLSDDSDKPINISAETQQADFNAETITYTGAVRIQQGDLTLRADTVTAEVPDSRLSRVTASGDVVITSQEATARAPLAVYDVKGRTIRLTGEVVMTQGGSTLRGTDLLVDLQAGTAVLTGKGSSSGRVEGILQPGDAKTQ